MELVSSELCLPLGIASGRLGSPSLLKITNLFLMHIALAEKSTGPGILARLESGGLFMLKAGQESRCMGKLMFFCIASETLQV